MVLGVVLNGIKRCVCVSHYLSLLSLPVCAMNIAFKGIQALCSPLVLYISLQCSLTNLQALLSVVLPDPSLSP